MAYGPGTSLSGLSFTPVVAIMITKKSSESEYLPFIAIRGYDTSSPIFCYYPYGNGFCSCIFRDNNITFQPYQTLPFFNYNAYIAAFGA